MKHFWLDILFILALSGLALMFALNLSAMSGLHS